MTYNNRNVNSMADIPAIDVVVDCGNLGIFEADIKHYCTWTKMLMSTHHINCYAVKICSIYHNIVHVYCF